MIQLHIICKDAEQAKEITTLLFEERLVLNEIIVNHHLSHVKQALEFKGEF